MTQTSPVRRRRPSAGGYARGEETRERIVEAALRVFGEEGYGRASTRRIAEEAEVSPPALQYYFDSKEGLHRACAERMLADATPLTDALERADRALADEGAARAADLLVDVLMAVVDLTLDTRSDSGRARFIARAQAEGEGPALPLIRQRLVRPTQEVLARLVAAALGRDPAGEEVRLRACVLLAQVSAFGAGRENTLRFLDWPDFTGEGRRDTLRAVLREHSRSALRPCD